MKILVLSDTHNDLTTSANIIKACRQGCDLVIHLGDTVKDFEHLRLAFPEIAFVGVKGNNDFLTNDVDKEIFLNLDGVNVFACHGHEYGVKRDTDNLLWKAMSKDAHIALYGHTHVAEKNTESGIILFNPGAVIEGNFGIIQIYKSQIASVDIFRWDRLRGKIV